MRTKKPQKEPSLSLEILDEAKELVLKHLRHIKKGGTWEDAPFENTFQLDTVRKLINDIERIKLAIEAVKQVAPEKKKPTLSEAETKDLESKLRVLESKIG